MRHSWALATLLVGQVVGQAETGVVSWIAFGGGSSLCNGTFAEANGTGIYSLNPHISLESNGIATGDASPVGVAVTVESASDPKHPAQWSIWFSPNGADYNNDLALGYDVCGFGIGALPAAINARAQNDNGSCYDMFSQACVNDIENLAADAAQQRTLAPNTTFGPTSLEGVCDYISATIMSDLPSSCSPYLNFSSRNEIVYGLPLTRYNTSYPVVLNDSCTIADGFESYSLLGTATGTDNSNNTYDTFVDTPATFLLVWMPVANSQRTTYITSSHADMLCARVNSFSKGSRVPPPVSVSPATTSSIATSTSSGIGEVTKLGSNGIGNGAIAGIVIGVLALLIISLLAWWLLKRRRSTRAGEAHETGMPSRPVTPTRMLEKDLVVVSEMEAVRSTRNELPPEGTHGGVLAEVDGRNCRVPELGTEQAPRELAASKRQSELWEKRRRDGNVAELEG